LEVRLNVGYDCDLRQLFMPSWKKIRFAGGIAIRVLPCRLNNPNQGSSLVVAATDFMPASAGSPSLQLPPTAREG
jgi:hypothetical protein